MNAPQRRFIFESTLLLITALLLTFFSIREEWAAPLDRILYDFYVGQYQAPRHPDVVIVSIDDSSLHTYGPWPWPRDLQAKLLRRVQSHKPSLVAADVIYTGNSSTDAELVAAAQQLPILALPVMIERLGYDRQHIEVMPYPELLGVTDLLGHVHVELDDDALVRGTFLYQGIHTPHWPHLMLAIARQLRGLPAAPATCASAPETLLTIRKCDYVRLPFAGPPGTYPQIPAELLLADEASQANLLDRALQNKVVIVGLTATGVGDWVTSPTSPTGSDVGPMSGVEFNANLLSALYYDSTISTPPLWWAVLLGCGIVTLCSLTLPRLRPKQMLIITAVLTVTPVLITWLSLAVFAAYLPLATASVAVLVIYPLWSWRRHEIAWSFIQGELNRVGDESRQLHSTITWHTSHKQPAEIVEHLKVMLGTDLNLAMLVPDKANDLQENPAIEVLSEPAREILRDTRLMLTRDTPEPGLPGEILAKQIRKLQFRAQEVREGRAIGLAGLGRMNNGALIISALGEVRFMNNAAASLLQVDPDATQPPDLLNMLSHIAPPLGQTWQDIMRDVVLRKKPVAFEGTAGRMPLFIAAEPLPTQYTSGANENNQASSYAPFWVLTLSDLTAIRTAQAQREEALAFLSHDIRSPLLSVLALIRGNKEDPHLLEKISNYTQKGLSTSDQFLQLSRLQLQTDFERYDVELSQVVHNAVEQAFFLAREKHISIVVSGQLGPDGEDQPVWLQANGELLERALDNLLSNAVKYSEADTTIHVTMTTTPDSVAISIADEGYGIPEDELVDIFEPFFRSAEQELAENRGAGLGLRFVKTVVDRHQGQIHASSTRHVGTTFTLTLPRPADPQSSTTASS